MVRTDQCRPQQPALRPITSITVGTECNQRRTAAALARASCFRPRFCRAVHRPAAPRVPSGRRRTASNRRVAAPGANAAGARRREDSRRCREPVPQLRRPAASASPGWPLTRSPSNTARRRRRGAIEGHDRRAPARRRSSRRPCRSSSNSTWGVRGLAARRPRRRAAPLIRGVSAATAEARHHVPGDRSPRAHP